jgi:elongator complex protein 3
MLEMKKSEKQRKPTKTISGVAPLAVMLPPKKCEHGACLYCPSLNAPQSYTPQSPAVLRAAKVNYDAKKQVLARLEAFKVMKHPTDKIELIIMGGTFLGYDEKFQEAFVKACYDGLNKRSSRNLEHAKKLNEKARHRCVALCIETRPDFCTEEHVKKILRWGATRVELGVQAIDDSIYRKVNRGHTVEDVATATERLKKAGFKIGYHLMPGIPGSNTKKDLKMLKEIFKSVKFKPDQIKIYPCQVLKGSGLESLYYGGEYTPYTKEQTQELIIKMLKIVPEYCRVMRIMREIPPSFLVAGIVNIDLRKDIEEKIREEGVKIKEMRFREIGFALRDKRKVNLDVKIKKTEYKASNGKEVFLQAVNKDGILFGLLRLRLEKDRELPALVRELHVYGPALKLHEKGEESQHLGLGRKLMKEAERIAKKDKRKTIKVISGVGVREYYSSKMGYVLDEEGIYMKKFLE